MEVEGECIVVNHDGTLSIRFEHRDEEKPVIMVLSTKTTALDLEPVSGNYKLQLNLIPLGT